jgi:hypothetical protein
MLDVINSGARTLGDESTGYDGRAGFQEKPADPYPRAGEQVL